MKPVLFRFIGPDIIELYPLCTWRFSRCEGENFLAVERWHYLADLWNTTTVYMQHFSHVRNAAYTVPRH